MTTEISDAEQVEFTLPTTMSPDTQSQQQQQVEQPHPSWPSTADEPHYGSVQHYARTLQQWMWGYQHWNSTNTFYSMMPYYMMGNAFPPMPGLNNNIPVFGRFPSTPPAAGPPGNRPPHRMDLADLFPRGFMPRQGHALPNSPNMTGTEYILPSVWRRLAAELIDFFILFYIKLMVSIGVMRHMGILESDHFEIDNFYRTLILTPDEVDFEKAFALTSEIIALEVINRICITIVETLCLRQGVGVIGGATPGKRMLGMRVVSCREVTDLGNGRVIVRPAQNIGFISALVRSVIKNFTLAFFFPACLTIFIFHHHRAAYDVIAGTIVVQPIENRDRQR